MDVHKRIGKKLTTHRNLMCLSQTDVARKLNLKSTAMISRWERGISLPSLDNALKLSVLYKTLVNELFWYLFVDHRDKLLQKEEIDQSGNSP
ncbi:MAG: helix-turn-helix transcriptional regulator [Bacteroidetes bacterium]|nr:helix-turn-helix transcriptional regulator [Bacteroidota bacterium]